jgi:hypothetical protein
MTKRIFSILFLGIIAQGFGQSLGNSPYSSFGIGDIYPRGFANFQGMGGAGVASANGIYSNGINPALLAYNKFTIFEVGVMGQMKNLSTGALKQRDIGGNLHYLNLTFPMGKKGSMAVGIKPYSSVDFESRRTEKAQGADTTKVSYIKRGTGGINAATWAYGVTPIKNLYLGAAADFYFGNIIKQTTSEVLDGSSYRLDFNERLSTKGAGLRGGIGYRQKINKKWFANFGATFEASPKLNASSLSTRAALAQANDGSYQPITAIDTLLNKEGGKITLPSGYRLGVTIESPLKWNFSADYILTNWSKYADINGASSLKNTSGIALGTEYTPNINAFSYFKKVTYRFGVSSTKTPFAIGGQQQDDRNVSVGLMLPMGRSASYANFSFVAGQRGTKATISDSYLRMVMGFTLADRWFYKVKID